MRRQRGDQTCIGNGCLFSSVAQCAYRTRLLNGSLLVLICILYSSIGELSSGAFLCNALLSINYNGFQGVFHSSDDAGHSARGEARRPPCFVPVRIIFLFCCSVQADLEAFIKEVRLAEGSPMTASNYSRRLLAGSIRRLHSLRNQIFESPPSSQQATPEQPPSSFLVERVTPPALSAII